MTSAPPASTTCSTFAREGPCLSAIHTATIVHVDDFADESRHPVFSRAATGDAVASCLSVPLAASGRTIGGLNLYGEASSACHHRSVAAATELAAQGALLLSITKAHHASAALVAQLQAAMTRRAVIEQEGSSWPEQDAALSRPSTCCEEILNVRTQTCTT